MAHKQFDVESIAALLRQTEANLSVLNRPPPVDYGQHGVTQPRSAWAAHNPHMSMPAEPMGLPPGYAAAAATAAAPMEAPPAPPSPVHQHRLVVAGSAATSQLEEQIFQLRTMLEALARRFDAELHAFLGICDKRFNRKAEEVKEVGEEVKASLTGMTDNLTRRVDRHIRKCEHDQVESEKRERGAVDEVWEAIRRLQGEARSIEQRCVQGLQPKDVEDKLRELDASMKRAIEERIVVSETFASEQRAKQDARSDSRHENLTKRCNELDQRVWGQQADRGDLVEQVLKRLPDASPLREVQELLRQQAYAVEVQDHRMKALEAKISKLPGLENRVEFVESNTATQLQEAKDTSRVLHEVAAKLSQKLSASETVLQRVDTHSAQLEARLSEKMDEDREHTASEAKELEQRIKEAEERAHRSVTKLEREVTQQLTAVQTKAATDGQCAVRAVDGVRQQLERRVHDLRAESNEALRRQIEVLEVTFHQRLEAVEKAAEPPPDLARRSPSPSLGAEQRRLSELRSEFSTALDDISTQLERRNGEFEKRMESQLRFLSDMHQGSDDRLRARVEAVEVRVNSAEGTKSRIEAEQERLKNLPGSVQTLQFEMQSLARRASTSDEQVERQRLTLTGLEVKLDGMQSSVNALRSLESTVASAGSGGGGPPASFELEQLRERLKSSEERSVRSTEQLRGEVSQLRSQIDEVESKHLSMSSSARSASQDAISDVRAELAALRSGQQAVEERSRQGEPQVKQLETLVQDHIREVSALREAVSACQIAQQQQQLVTQGRPSTPTGGLGGGGSLSRQGSGAALGASQDPATPKASASLLLQQQQQQQLLELEGRLRALEVPSSAKARSPGPGAAIGISGLSSPEGSSVPGGGGSAAGDGQPPWAAKLETRLERLEASAFAAAQRASGSAPTSPAAQALGADRPGGEGGGGGGAGGGGEGPRLDELEERLRRLEALGADRPGGDGGGGGGGGEGSRLDELDERLRRLEALGADRPGGEGGEGGGGEGGGGGGGEGPRLDELDERLRRLEASSPTAAGLESPQLRMLEEKVEEQERLLGGVQEALVAVQALQQQLQQQQQQQQSRPPTPAGSSMSRQGSGAALVVSQDAAAAGATTPKGPQLRDLELRLKSLEVAAAAAGAAGGGALETSFGMGGSSGVVGGGEGGAALASELRERQAQQQSEFDALREEVFRRIQELAASARSPSAPTSPSAGADALGAGGAAGGAGGGGAELAALAEEQRAELRGQQERLQAVELRLRQLEERLAASASAGADHGGGGGPAAVGSPSVLGDASALLLPGDVEARLGRMEDQLSRLGRSEVDAGSDRSDPTLQRTGTSGESQSVLLLTLPTEGVRSPSSLRGAVAAAVTEALAGFADVMLDVREGPSTGGGIMCYMTVADIAGAEAELRRQLGHPDSSLRRALPWLVVEDVAALVRRVSAGDKDRRDAMMDGVFERLEFAERQIDSMSSVEHRLALVESWMLRGNIGDAASALGSPSPSPSPSPAPGPLAATGRFGAATLDGSSLGAAFESAAGGGLAGGMSFRSGFASGASGMEPAAADMSGRTSVGRTPAAEAAAAAASVAPPPASDDGEGSVEFDDAYASDGSPEPAARRQAAARGRAPEPAQAKAPQPQQPQQPPPQPQQPQHQEERRPEQEVPAAERPLEQSLQSPAARSDGASSGMPSLGLDGDDASDASDDDGRGAGGAAGAQGAAAAAAAAAAEEPPSTPGPSGGEGAAGAPAVSGTPARRLTEQLEAEAAARQEEEQRRHASWEAAQAAAKDHPRKHRIAEGVLPPVARAVRTKDEKVIRKVFDEMLQQGEEALSPEDVKSYLSDFLGFGRAEAEAFFRRLATGEPELLRFDAFKSGYASLDPHVLRKRQNELIFRKPGALAGKDACLESLEDCEVYICDTTAQIFVDECKRSLVLLGPCQSSVFVRDCEDCVFWIAAQQLRTRDCKRCTFYLYSKTDPIIELSDDMTFAPWSARYPGCTEQFASVGFDASRNFWNAVFDFNGDPNRSHWRIMGLEDAVELVVELPDEPPPRGVRAPDTPCGQMTHAQLCAEPLISEDKGGSLNIPQKRPDLPPAPPPGRSAPRTHRIVDQVSRHRRALGVETLGGVGPPAPSAAAAGTAAASTASAVVPPPPPPPAPLGQQGAADASPPDTPLSGGGGGGGGAVEAALAGAGGGAASDGDSADDDHRGSGGVDSILGAMAPSDDESDESSDGGGRGRPSASRAGPGIAGGGPSPGGVGGGGSSGGPSPREDVSESGDLSALIPDSPPTAAGGGPAGGAFAGAGAADAAREEEERRRKAELRRSLGEDSEDDDEDEAPRASPSAASARPKSAAAAKPQALSNLRLGGGGGGGIVDSDEDSEDVERMVAALAPQGGRSPAGLAHTGGAGGAGAAAQVGAALGSGLGAAGARAGGATGATGSGLRLGGFAGSAIGDWAAGSGMHRAGGEGGGDAGGAESDNSFDDDDDAEGESPSPGARAVAAELGLDETGGSSSVLPGVGQGDASSDASPSPAPAATGAAGVSPAAAGGGAAAAAGSGSEDDDDSDFGDDDDLDLPG